MNLKLFGAAALISVASALAEPDPNFHIYLAFGQSNMEGQGNIESQDKNAPENFQVMWSANNGSCTGRTKGQWYTANPPLASCDGKLGPADYFGRAMLDSLPKGAKVGVIVVAVAGCDIQLFEKGNYSSYVSKIKGDFNQSWMASRISNYGDNPYGRLVELAKEAQKVGVIKGILLHQGETNSGQQNWPSRVKGIYDDLIKDLGLDASKVPLVAGEVHPRGVSAGMNSVIANLPNQSKNFYVASAQGINGVLGDGQNVHFDAAGYRELGKRYASTMVKALRTAGAFETPVPSSSSVVPVESSSSEVASSSATKPVQSSSSVEPAASSSSITPVESSNAMAIDAVAGLTPAIGEAVFAAGRVMVPVSMNGAKNVSAKAYSMLGKEVLDFSKSFASGAVGFETSALPSGTYMLSVQVGSVRSIQKVNVK